MEILGRTKFWVSCTELQAHVTGGNIYRFTTVTDSRLPDCRQIAFRQCCTRWLWKSLWSFIKRLPDSKNSWDQHGSHLGRVGPDGPYVGPMYHAIISYRNYSPRTSCTQTKRSPWWSPHIGDTKGRHIGNNGKVVKVTALHHCMYRRPRALEFSTAAWQPPQSLSVKMNNKYCDDANK